jgi:hypothetical protein
MTDAVEEASIPKQSALPGCTVKEVGIAPVDLLAVPTCAGDSAGVLQSCVLFKTQTPRLETMVQVHAIIRASASASGTAKRNVQPR